MVEVYFNQELEDVVFDIDSQETWKQLSEELGLTKQLDFIKEKESPLPYPYMNESMQRIYSTLCPRRVNFKEYDKTPIPTQVLEQIALSVRDKYFQDLEIWFDDKAPDPLVVGKTCKYFYNAKGEDKKYIYFTSKEECKNHPENKGLFCETDINYYIIARWGDVLRPLKELKQIAKERLIDKYASELQKEIKEKTEALKVIQENANLYLLAEITENQLKGAKW